MTDSSLASFLRRSVDSESPETQQLVAKFERWGSRRWFRAQAVLMTICLSFLIAIQIPRFRTEGMTPLMLIALVFVGGCFPAGLLVARRRVKLLSLRRKLREAAQTEVLILLSSGAVAGLGALVVLVPTGVLLPAEWGTLWPWFLVTIPFGALALWGAAKWLAPWWDPDWLE